MAAFTDITRKIVISTRVKDSDGKKTRLTTIDKLSETASADEVMAAAQAFADLMEEDVLNIYVQDKNEVIAG